MQLAYPRNRSNRLDVRIIERVTGIEAHARIANRLARKSNFFQFGQHRGTLGISSLCIKRMGIRAGMDFAYSCADTVGCFHLR